MQPPHRFGEGGLITNFHHCEAGTSVPDLILIDADVVTVDDAEIAAATEVRDLAEKTLIAGFLEPHSHPTLLEPCGAPSSAMSWITGMQ